MNKFQKTQLLLATALVGSVAGTAQAQVVFPAAELHGMGASSIATIMPREMNCIGTAGIGTADASGNYTNVQAAGVDLKDNAGTVITKANIKAGDNNGGVTVRKWGAYTGADAAFDCATKSVQPGFAAAYVSTGSGGGKTAWAAINAGAFFTGAAGKIFPAAFGTTWSNPHFVMSDSPISSGNVSSFNTASATKKAGAAIQVPLYVLPVAFIYNPVYGRKVDASGNTVLDASGNAIEYKFNVATPVTFNGTATGGLRLSKKAYCGIFNGVITNWKDATLQALNVGKVGKTSVALSLMDSKDSATRWASDGVPIRLVGRLDKSGTTDIFTRHLAAVCGSSLPVGTANKYLNAAEALPYSTASNIDLTSFRSDSPYKPTTTDTLAGTADLISGAVWTGSALNVTQGAEAAGKFTVADGSGRVESYIRAAADVASASDATVLLNGKIGYIGADFVAPSTGMTMHAAALEVAQTNGTKKPLFAMPTAADAQAAFGTKILPPESDKGGKFTHSGQFLRSNPLDWYNALYNGDSTLANPTVGYPVTGTTQFVTGTCFAKAQDRNALVFMLNTLLGNTKFDSANNKLSSETFTGIKAAKLGIRPQAGLAPLPKAWNVAITETFLVRSKQKASDGTTLASQNLYIQNGVPTKAGLVKIKSLANGVVAASDLPATVDINVTDAKGKTKTYANVEAGPNPTCTTIGSGL
ncbi:substrate-binding domain-containing protein [Novosphingobium percolationis]|uniref:substrate-binding domain-containing protein n=1 Tax=Novosphingobium percolationis TaxID=2871811 RepID=UPI001CD71280|nr:substrate-binding domain-containing protein [Novosphingobium percolationis]